MSKVIIEVPAEVAEALRLPVEEQPSRMRREFAIRLYQKGLLAFGKARELAGLTKWDFHCLLGDEGVPRRYDVEDLHEDLTTLERLA